MSSYSIPDRIIQACKCQGKYSLCATKKESWNWGWYEADILYGSIGTENDAHAHNILRITQSEVEEIAATN